MRVEFRQGVPPGCIEWLWNNVGPGNIEPRGDPGVDWGDAWLYKRERVYPQPHEAFDPRDTSPRYVPTITVKDEKLAMLFILRWS